MTSPRANRAASVCTSEQSKGVQFNFGSVLTLTSQSAEAGQASVTCDVTTPGQPTRVKLDPRFVLDFLRAEHVLVVQGTGFNWPKPDHLRIVTLPWAKDLTEAIGRLGRFLSTWVPPKD